MEVPKCIRNFTPPGMPHQVKAPRLLGLALQDGDIMAGMIGTLCEFLQQGSAWGVLGFAVPLPGTPTQ